MMAIRLGTMNETFCRMLGSFNATNSKNMRLCRKIAAQEYPCISSEGFGINTENSDLHVPNNEKMNHKWSPIDSYARVYVGRWSLSLGGLTIKVI